MAKKVGDELITAEGTMMGTPLFMSPEQFRGRGDLIDQRTDIWSAGVMLYYFLSKGKFPFPGVNMMQIFVKVTREEPVPLPNNIPISFREVVYRALQKSPEDRFQTAAEMRQALEDALAEAQGRGGTIEMNVYDEDGGKECTVGRPSFLPTASSPTICCREMDAFQQPPRPKKFWWLSAGLVALGAIVLGAATGLAVVYF